jgi:predicted nucleic acid-binding protein
LAALSDVAVLLTCCDAIQAASALAINADALVTHDQDFAPVRGLRVLG